MPSETRSQASSLERNSFDDIDDDMIVGPSTIDSKNNNAETPTKGKKNNKTSVAALSKKAKNKNRNQSKSSLRSSGQQTNN